MKIDEILLAFCINGAMITQTLCLVVLQHRVHKGWVRKRMIKMFGPFIGRSAPMLLLGVPFLTCAFAVGVINPAYALAPAIIYYTIILTTDVIDILTSIDNPPWKRASKALSRKIRKMVERMKTRGLAPGLPQPT